MFKWILYALFLMLSAWIVPGVHVNGFWAAMLAVLVIGMINFFVRPLIQLLTLPVTVVTLGLFLFVINGIVFWMASGLYSGLYVDNFMSAVLCSLVYSLLTSVFMSRK